MAHQLATGNFEALFINEEQRDEQGTEKPTTQKKPERNFTEIDSIERGETVYSEVNCCFCGHVGKYETRWGNYFIKCPACKEALFNSWATGTEYELNSWGCAYLASTPMKQKNQNDEIEKHFLEGDSNEN